MNQHPELWGWWANPTGDFLHIASHEKEYNNQEWHLSHTFSQLMFEPVRKTYTSEISTVLSSKYHDIGHVKRIDFVKYIETKLDIHVYGNNKFSYKHYKGPLPPYCKDDGIFPYKYTFNVENNSILNYCTEKFVDAILGECLIFYNGCPNIRELFDERCFIWLDLVNFEDDYKKIQTAIQENLWEERIPFIRAEKQRILTSTQFFPRLHKIINDSTIQ
jgi:hypothetical protein